MSTLGILRIQHQLLLICVVYLLVTGCTTPQVVTLTPDEGLNLLEILEEGLNDNCQLPCWYDFTAGSTTVDDISDTLGTYPFLNQADCLNVSQAYDDISVLCTGYYTDDVAIVAGFDLDEVLLGISLTQISYAWEPTFSDVVAQFGNPAGAKVARSEIESDTECAAIDPDNQPFSLLGDGYGLLYPDMGMIVHADLESPDHWPCIRPEMRVTEIYITAPANEPIVLVDWYVLATLNRPNTDGRVGEFPGWGIEITEDD